MVSSFVGLLYVTETWYVLLQPFKMLLLTAIYSSAGRLAYSAVDEPLVCISVSAELLHYCPQY